MGEVRRRRVRADAFFIGGGGYGLVTDTNNRSLRYGGFLMQWFGRTSETFGFSGKMLIGWGEAESTEAVQVYDNRGRASLQAVRVHQNFYVFEPEVNGLVRLSRNVRLTGGAGYRFTGNGWYSNYYYSYGYPNSLNPSGWTASVGGSIRLRLSAASQGTALQQQLRRGRPSGRPTIRYHGAA